MRDYRELGRKTTTHTSTFTTSDIKIAHHYTAMNVWVKTTDAGGTSPTLNLIIQRAIKPPAITDVEWTETTGTMAYQDWAAFAQITGNTERNMTVVGSGGEEYAVSDGTLAAGTIRSGAIPPAFRIKGVIAGTSPSFGVQIVVQLIP